MIKKRTHTQIWNILKKGMGKRWDACRHECSATVGVPDVSFGCNGINGWIELKSVSGWPKRHKKLNDLTIHQAKWMSRRGKTGGYCSILISVGEDWVLTDYVGALFILEEGLPPREEVYGRLTVWNGEIDWKEFEEKICQQVQVRRRTHENG